MEVFLNVTSFQKKQKYNLISFVADVLNEGVGYHIQTDFSLQTFENINAKLKATLIKSVINKTRTFNTVTRVSKHTPVWMAHFGKRKLLA